MRIQPPALPQEVVDARSRVRANPAALSAVVDLLRAYERIHSDRYEKAKDALVLSNNDPVRVDAVTQLGARNAMRSLIALLGDK